jgi:penicillin amidase
MSAEQDVSSDHRPGASAPARTVLARRLAYGAAAFAGVTAIVFAVAYLLLRASLPLLDGSVQVHGLSADATIERDANGVPTLRASTRRDLAFATGYVHAQERFFQMDLMRRAAAGELAALLGPALIDTDKRLRMHAFKSVAARVVARESPERRALLEAYVAGVNAAMTNGSARPWEYLLLRSVPREWSAEDSILVAFSMYLNLNDSSGAGEAARGLLREALPAEVFDFLHPFGTEWDAAITGGTWRAAPIPSADIVDLRRGAGSGGRTPTPSAMRFPPDPPVVGSNSWAVAGTHTQSGGALLANDMHLGLRVPHVWYRARLVVRSNRDARDLIGVTLPGLPLLIAGSNGRVAWGYTNSYGDWTDLVVVEPDPDDAQRYATADGGQAFATRNEVIEVRGEAPVNLTVKATRWGPVIDRDARGRPLALTWTAHDPAATDLGMLEFEGAANVDQLLDAANRAGGPVQNVVAADADGRIGWSFMGRVPVRVNYDSTVPASRTAVDVGWNGWRRADEYPRIVDPPTGRLWTANARTVDAQTWLGFMGDGGHDLGARAAQIRDGLFAIPQASAADMAKLQIDDRALFLTRWRDLLLDVLDAGALAAHSSRAEARDLVDRWSGHASADDVGYAIVRAFRNHVRERVFASIIEPAAREYPQMRFRPSNQFEAPLWQLVTQRPRHMLDPRYATWEESLLASLDAAVAALSERCGKLSTCTWGYLNTLSMRHPLSAALPWGSRWLDMPHVALAGDVNMPRVQGVEFGASQRLVVSPGKEAEGYFQMPGGQAGHPLSPFYGAGHDAWARGEPMPLLPGETQYTLTLKRPLAGD